MPFDPSILRPDARREEIVSVLQAALDAVDPFKAVRRRCTVTAIPHGGGRRYDLARYRCPRDWGRKAGASAPRPWRTCWATCSATASWW
ncbi:MAG: hypothetical protein R2873_05720 [Caldilineaceae bacterium]